MFTPPAGDPADTGRPRGRSTVPMDDATPPPALPPPTPAQTLDAAATILLDAAVDAAAKYIEEDRDRGMFRHERRQNLIDAASAYATVRAAAVMAGESGAGSKSGAGAIASMVAGAGLGVATGTLLGTAAAADDAAPVGIG